MKKRDSEDPLLVIIFTLVPKEKDAGNDAGAPAKEAQGESDDLD